MVLPLLSFKSTNLINPGTAALVVVSRPTMDNPVASVRKTDIIKYEPLERDVSRGGYLDSDLPDVESTQEEVTVEIIDPANEEPVIHQEAKLTPSTDTVPAIKKQEAPQQQTLQTVYTIQTGSFTNVPKAQEQFHYLINELENDELNFLRIEKIGKFNAVRLGSFENYGNAEEFLNTVKPRVSNAIIMKAYIKEQRIIQQFVE